MNFGFVIDNRKCIGCHACTVACKAEHDVPIGVNRTWVKYIEKGEFPHTTRHFSVMRCNHCSDAPCVEICPVTALFTRKDGIVDFDNRRCIGCKACMQACPYDALYIDPETHTAAKCNYCAHRVDIGLEPACVNVCPEHAIVSGDLDDPESEIAQLVAREPVTARKPEKGTEPRLFYIDGDRVSLNPALAGQSEDYLWNSQSTGVGHFAHYAEKRASQTAENGADQAEEWVGKQDSRVLVPEGSGPKGRAKAREVKEENTRRVYDAPSKGAVWGWEVAAYVWTKAIATGTFLVFFGISFLIFGDPVPPINLMATLLFLALTGLLLVKDLDRPGRFLYVLLRPQWRSWLVRGGYLISALGIVLTVELALMIVPRLRINLRLAPIALNILEWIAFPLAVLTAIYTAFLFAQAKGRDFWQSPLASVQMLTHAVMAGSALGLILKAAIGLADLGIPFLESALTGGRPLQYVLFAATGIHMLLIWLELATSHSTEDARKTVGMIVKGRFSRLFWLVVVALGGLIPMVLLALSEGPESDAAAGLLVLIGLYITQHIWVKAPQQIPLS